MQLRSASVKKTLFPFSPVFGKAKVVHSPAQTVREQKDQQSEKEKKSQMADTVEALSQCCASAEAKVQRIRIAIETAGLDYDKFNVHALNLYLKTVDAAYAEYNDFQNRIYLTNPTKRAEFEPKFVDFEELYEFVRIALCEMLQKHEDDQKAIALAAQQQQMLALKYPPPGGTSGSGAGSIPPRTPSLLLQQTPLPTFDGRYENWFKFKSMFCDIIDKCVTDSPATKLHYLDKALVGKAQGAIDQQTLNDNNYDGAWKSLQERFENLPMVIHGHVTKLLNLKPMARESFQELKNLVDDCEKRVDSLEFHKLKMGKMAEAIIITLLTSKLDSETRKCWENTIEHGKMPIYKDMIAFLRKRSYVLERCEQTVGPSRARTTVPAPKPAVMPSKTHSVVVQRSEDNCPVCEASHAVEKCDAFKKLNVESRYSKARQVGLCFSCLKKGHRTPNCKANVVCSSCSKKHHILMHPEERQASSNPPKAPVVEDKPEAGSSGQPLTAAKCVVPDAPREATKQVLLATAIVEVIDAAGARQKCRALLDSGAMANFVSERMVNLLCLPKTSVDIPVIGVNGMKSMVKFKVHAVVKSRTTTFEFGQDYLIVPRVTGALPNTGIDIRSWPIPENIVLADEKFNEPSRIDILIGAEMFYELLQSGKIRMSGDLPLFQESLLGWLVAGPVAAESSTCSIVRVCQVARSNPEEDLHELLKRFWVVEEQVVDVESTAADEGCEEHFSKTHSRTEDGRYVVMLPFRSNVAELGESRKLAVRRFEHLERRFEKNTDMKRMYKEFIDEYIALGHCKEVDTNAEDGSFAYFLPHHCVMKPDSSSTKLRVVFDASAKSETGLSLNDVMKVGPTVQSSLFDIILLFRTFRYTFTADVSKMYRQILIDSLHIKYQTILWRDDRSKPLKELELKTVTYGTAAAPFLATRSLNQLADDEKDFPAASAVVKKSFYIDDVLTGANSLEEAKALQEELIALLGRGGFSLHKWCANDPTLLENIPQEAQEKQLKFEDCDVNGTIKTLGLYWDPTADEFLFRVNPMNDSLKRPTKRQVLSETAKIFDPLGLLAPTVLLPKLLMQRLWQEKVEWDEEIPQEVLRTWNQFRSELSGVSEMKIDRRITTNEAVKCELHGFADSSGKAYGCCIYLRNVEAGGTATVKLVCGKSRVAPMKELQREVKPDAQPEQLTIPRLELCAALLLARQMKAVREALDFGPNQVTLWSDSSIVLSWLQRLKPDTSVFVRNHVSKIHHLNPDAVWRHVSTNSNPADVASRGLFPNQLMACNLWWSGPEFLWTSDWNDTPFSADSDVHEVPEDTVAVVSLAVEEKPEMIPSYDLILAGSNFRRLQRIFGYVSRFIFNCRARSADRRSEEGLTNQDLEEATMNMVVCVQRVVFAEEIDCILKGKPVKGKLKNLNPVLDGKALRVGGRIRHSDLPKNQKHPLILPENNHFTEILVTNLHREHLHLGVNSLLAVVRQRYWPVNAKRTIHRVLKKCVICFRMKPKTLDQYMGDLPSARVTAAQPFSRTGVDYAGPFFIKQGRGKTKLKAYVCLFVCMSTKAIHLELVSSLTTDGFIEALHRFVGRRGNVSKLFSDNGTNFTGAYKELEALRELFNSQMLKDRVNEFCQERGIEWRFNAPRAPHQGGLWEANVKCMKNHLYKSFSEAYLTYEEFNTVLIQVEAILNSRPLIPMTNDPFDYEALSPGHFLIGRELTSVAEPFYDGLKDGALSRYQLLQKRKQSFWRRWSNEYVTTLQKRSKWTNKPTLLRNGLLVILKEDNVPPQMWKLGRIVETHPGKDGVTRVVTVRTTSGTYRRPTTKIAVLPIDDNIQ